MSVPSCRYHSSMLVLSLLSWLLVLLPVATATESYTYSCYDHSDCTGYPTVVNSTDDCLDSDHGSAEACPNGGGACTCDNIVYCSASDSGCSWDMTLQFLEDCLRTGFSYQQNNEENADCVDNTVECYTDFLDCGSRVQVESSHIPNVMLDPPSDMCTHDLDGYNFCHNFTEQATGYYCHLYNGCVGDEVTQAGSIDACLDNRAGSVFVCEDGWCECQDAVWCSDSDTGCAWSMELVLLEECLATGFSYQLIPEGSNGDCVDNTEVCYADPTYCTSSYQVQGSTGSWMNPASENCTIWGGSNACYCGNGEVDNLEFCDGDDLGGMDCNSFGHDGGVLGCNDDCTFDLQQCSRCGDNLISGDEECEADNLDGQTCLDLGYYGGGDLACSDDCTFDVSGCQRCGDGVLQYLEMCDGNDLGELTCQDFGWESGVLACDDVCELDNSGCFTCGDGMVTGTEACDTDNPDGKSCQYFGYFGGQLGCDDSCAFDVSACTTAAPSATPTLSPSYSPSHEPSYSPSMAPTSSPGPSAIPSAGPSVHPFISPSAGPSVHPSLAPSRRPSATPSQSPTVTPTTSPKPSISVWTHHFDGTSDNFSFVLNAFGTACTVDTQMLGYVSNSAYGNGSGGVKIELYSAGKSEQLSGAFYVAVTLSEAMDDTQVHFQYKTRFQNGFASNDVGKVLVGLDATQEVLVENVIGTTTSDTWTTGSANFGYLETGTHTLAFGSYLDVASTTSGLSFNVRFDNVELTGVPVAASG